MNAGRDVEQLIATWLVEEAPARAPDRILADAHTRIDRTKQQRFAAAWREPMIISTGRLVAAAAVLVFAVVGAGWLGRATAPSGASAGTGPLASPLPSASSPATLESYRAARDAICQRASASGQTLNDAFTNPYDPNQTPAQLNAKADRLQDIVDFGDSVRRELAAIPVPPDLAAEQMAVIARGEDVRVILEQEVALLRAGKVSEAQQLDLLTDPINRQVEAFERKYSLSPCP